MVSTCSATFSFQRLSYSIILAIIKKMDLRSAANLVRTNSVMYGFMRPRDKFDALRKKVEELMESKENTTTLLTAWRARMAFMFSRKDAYLCTLTKDEFKGLLTVFDERIIELRGIIETIEKRKEKLFEKALWHRKKIRK